MSALRSAQRQVRPAAANQGLGQELTSSLAWLRRATDDAGVEIWEIWPGTGPRQRSPQSFRLWGMRQDETPDPAFMLARVRPEARQAFGAMFETAWSTGHAQLEFPIDRPRPDGTTELAWLRAEAFRIGCRGTPGAHLAGLTFDITARRLAEERVTALLGSAVEQQEAERLRIARDLHDRLGQHLALLHLELAALAKDAQPQARVARLAEMLCDLGREVHDIAVEIRPTAIDDLGLAAALQQLVENWSERTGIAADMHVRLPAARLSLPIETTLYRILQEPLTNVTKHAQASRVGVTLEASAQQVRMVVEDDGRGMAPQRAMDSRRPLGMQGIAERLELIGGSIDIESGEDIGTTLLIQVPL